MISSKTTRRRDMKRYSIGFVALLLIISIFAISCDGVINSLSQEDARVVGFIGMEALFHSILYAEGLDVGEGEEEEYISIRGIGDDGLDISMSGNEATMTWTNFDLGTSIQALIASSIVPEFIKDELPEFLQPGQIVILSGSANAAIDTGSINIQMRLKIENFDLEDTPNGTFNITIKMSNFGVEEEDDEDLDLELEITVNGVKVDFDIDDF